MKSKANEQKKVYVRPQVEVREGFEKNVLQSGCSYTPNISAACGWVLSTG